MPFGRHQKHPRISRQDQRDWLPLHDAAALARVTPSSLRREILLHGLPALKTREGWLLHRDVLEVFVHTREARRIAAEQNRRAKASNGGE